MEEANLIIEAAKEEAEKIINKAKSEADEITKEAFDLFEEAETIKREIEHQEKDNKKRIESILQDIRDLNLFYHDWQITANKDTLKRLKISHDVGTKVELITEWEIKNDTFISDSSLRQLIRFATLYCDAMIDILITNLNKKGLQDTLKQAIAIISSVEKLIPYQFKYTISEKYLERIQRKILLHYEIEEYKARKKEEQRILKEQQREEAAAQREFERELKKAQKDQAKAEEALRKAQEEAEKEKENSEKFAKFQEQIASLQSALEEAQQRSERVMSMAQQTRQGWVYIISNIGSFGENVYKIGMTRRLDPMERVAELGDASVPFPFDVHAMIFSEDAPALETALHHAFEGNRTNLINGKKEFFNVPLSDIKEKVKELGYDATFEDDAVAPQYRDTLFARRNH